jgi:ATP-binding cassette subfamily B (MDR/TAP) protein 1
LSKRVRKEIARQYYEAVNNVHAVRSMALESVFVRRFDESLETAMHTGIQGAFVADLGFSVASSMQYLTEGASFQNFRSLL